MSTCNYLFVSGVLFVLLGALEALAVLCSGLILYGLRVEVR